MGIEDEAGRAIGQVAGDVYADVARPAAQQVGTALGTVFKVGLSPFRVLDWGYEQAREWLEAKVARRLTQTPAESRVTPPNHIAIPALVAIASSSDSPGLRDMYAELLMKAMDARTQSTVHPSYVPIVGQLAPQEAFAFLSFRKVEEPHLFEELGGRWHTAPSIEQQFEKLCGTLGLPVENCQLWLDNLKRLGLIVLEEFSESTFEPSGGVEYASIRTNESRFLSLTALGRGFLEACCPPGDIVDENTSPGDSVPI